MDDHRCIVDVIEDVKSCRPAVDHLLELLPRLQPRYYSISSSPRVRGGCLVVGRLARFSRWGKGRRVCRGGGDGGNKKTEIIFDRKCEFFV